MRVGLFIFGRLVPHFAMKKIRLKEFSLRDAQQFYDEIQECTRGKGGRQLKPSTICRYHAALHNALEHAVKDEN